MLKITPNPPIHLHTSPHYDCRRFVYLGTSVVVAALIVDVSTACRCEYCQARADLTSRHGSASPLHVTGHLTADVLALLPEPVEQSRVPDSGVVAIPPHDFAETFSNFCFASNLTRLEVIDVRDDAACSVTREKGNRDGGCSGCYRGWWFADV